MHHRCDVLRRLINLVEESLQRDRKPILLNRFQQIIDRAALKSFNGKLVNSREPNREERIKWIKALVGQDVRMFPVDDVIFFQSDTKYTRVVTDTEDVLIRIPLKELIDGLDPEIFWQVHRGAIVNVRRIAKITRDGVEKHSIALRGSTEKIGVSRYFFHLFKQM